MPTTKNDQIPPGREAGAALLIIVAILAVIAALSIGTRYFGGSTRKLAQQTETFQDEVRFEDAIAAFWGRKTRLPCPADITAAAASQGLEARDVATGNCTAASFGAEVLPWKDLGLAESQVRDAWGNYYSYHVLPALAKDDALSATNFSSATGKLIIPGLRIKTANSSTTYLTESALMVIISHGPNGDSAYKSPTIQNAASTDADELANTDGDAQNIYVKSGTAGGKFDDILTYWLDKV